MARTVGFLLFLLFSQSAFGSDEFSRGRGRAALASGGIEGHLQAISAFHRMGDTESVSVHLEALADYPDGFLKLLEAQLSHALFDEDKEISNSWVAVQITKDMKVLRQIVETNTPNGHAALNIYGVPLLLEFFDKRGLYFRTFTTAVTPPLGGFGLHDRLDVLRATARVLHDLHVRTGFDLRQLQFGPPYERSRVIYGWLGFEFLWQLYPSFSEALVTSIGRETPLLQEDEPFALVTEGNANLLEILKDLNDFVARSKQPLKILRDKTRLAFVLAPPNEGLATDPVFVRLKKNLEAMIEDFLRDELEHIQSLEHCAEALGS